MKRIAFLLFGTIFLLMACTSQATEPAVSEPVLAVDDAQVAADEVSMPETAVNEQAAKPQFIMFTASW